MTSNVTKLEFLKVKHILLSIKEKQPYPINHQDIDTYQQDVRHLLKINHITNKADVYACQVALHVQLEDFTTWEEINEYYTMDYEQNKTHFYPLLGDAKCMCGKDCSSRFRVQFNHHYINLGSACINKDEIVGDSFKRYKKVVKPIYKLNKQYYKYVTYQTFKRFKFYKSKPILLKYRDKISRSPLYLAFLKMSVPLYWAFLQPIVKPIKGICGCGSICGKYPRCSICEIEHKKTLPYTCKCGVKSSYRCCYKCKQGICLVVI
jgi:hypothetical protein